MAACPAHCMLLGFQWRSSKDSIKTHVVATWCCCNTCQCSCFWNTWSIYLSNGRIIYFYIFIVFWGGGSAFVCECVCLFWGCSLYYPCKFNLATPQVMLSQNSWLWREEKNLWWMVGISSSTWKGPKVENTTLPSFFSNAWHRPAINFTNWDQDFSKTQWFFPPKWYSIFNAQTPARPKGPDLAWAQWMDIYV